MCRVPGLCCRAACCETAESRAAMQERSDPVRARGLCGECQTLRLPLRHLGGLEGGGLGWFAERLSL